MLIGSLKPGLYPSLEGSLRPQPDFLSPDSQGKAPFVGPLDSFASPWLVLSTKRLRSAYTGACMRVRRSSDNAEADIGFTPAGDLDTVALLAHVGGGSGFVRTWYDQSGGTRHAQQPTGASQPRIVNAGAIDTLNGLPAVKHTAATPTWMDVTGTITMTTVGMTMASLLNHPSATREIGQIFDTSHYLDFDTTGGGGANVDWRINSASIGTQASPGGSRSNPHVLIGRGSTVAGLARCDYKNAAGTTTQTNAASVTGASAANFKTSYNPALPFDGLLHTCVVLNVQLADGLFASLRDILAAYGGF